MTKEHEALLLTMARIMRAKIKNEIYAEQEDDLWAICDALKPFDGTGGVSLDTVLNTASAK